MKMFRYQLPQLLADNSINLPTIILPIKL